MVKVLIVDDEVDLEPLIIQKFRRQIRDGRYQFLFAHNGREALETITHNLDIDIVLTDINMPEMDGLTLLQQLENSPYIKAVVVSAYGDLANIRTAMNRGAFDFLTKPVNFEDLEITIERTHQHLQLMRSALDARTKLISVQQELNVASQLQQAILPKRFPNHQHIDLYAIMQPATEVGGDFYDFFWLDDKRLGVVMADVSGKGITSGLFMAIARTHLKAIAPYCYSPAECLTKLNQQLCIDNDTFMFVTVFYGVLDVTTGDFSYGNGGHCIPLILSDTGDVRRLPLHPGMGLGVFDEAVFEERSTQLKNKESLLLYTDGVTEAMNSDLQEYTLERLEQLLQQQQHLSMKELINYVVLDVKQFASQVAQSDDITCLAFRYLG